MKATNFTYWLKGFFELENPLFINENQVNIINDHLKIVIKDDESDDMKGPYSSPNDFVIWLNGFLDSKTDLSLAPLTKVKDKLDSVFNKVTPNRVNEAINKANQAISDIRENKKKETVRINLPQKPTKSWSPNKYC